MARPAVKACLERVVMALSVGKIAPQNFCVLRPHPERLSDGSCKCWIGCRLNLARSDCGGSDGVGLAVPEASAEDSSSEVQYTSGIHIVDNAGGTAPLD